MDNTQRTHFSFLQWRCAATFTTPENPRGGIFTTEVSITSQSHSHSHHPDPGPDPDPDPDHREIGSTAWSIPFSLSMIRGSAGWQSVNVKGLLWAKTSENCCKECIWQRHVGFITNPVVLSNIVNDQIKPYGIFAKQIVEYTSYYEDLWQERAPTCCKAVVDKEEDPSWGFCRSPPHHHSQNQLCTFSDDLSNLLLPPFC